MSNVVQQLELNPVLSALVALTRGGSQLTLPSVYEQNLAWVPTVTFSAGTGGSAPSLLGFMYNVVGNMVFVQGYLNSGTMSNTAAFPQISLPYTAYSAARQIFNAPCHISNGGAAVGFAMFDTNVSTTFFRAATSSQGTFTANIGFDVSFNFAYRKA